jgi:hypothetical protein
VGWLMIRSLVVLFMCFGCRIAFAQAVPAQGQDAAWSGPITITNSPTVIRAELFSGTDACAKILTAMGVLPPNGGVIDARAFSTLAVQPCAANPFISATTSGQITVISGAMVTGTLTGVNATNWTSAQIGGALFCGSPAGNFVGIVQGVAVGTQVITLTATALATCTLPGSYTISAKSGTLLLGNTTFSISSSWIVPDRWRVLGSGRGASSTSSSPNGTGTSIQANSSSFGPVVSSGHASTTAGSPGVTGSGLTGWTTALVGQMFVAAGGAVQAPILSVTNQTNLTLTIPAQTGLSGSTYSITPPLIQFNPTNNISTTGLATGVSVSNLNVDCNSITGGVGIQNWWAQELSYAQDVSIFDCNAISLDVETSSSQNSGPYANISSTNDAASRANANTLCAELLSSSQTDLRGVHGLTCIASITPAPSIGIDASMESLSLEDLHLEGYVTGISIGTNAEANNLTLINATGGTGKPGMTTLINIVNPTSYSPNNNEVNLFGLNSGGVATILNDQIMGTNLSDSSLSFYVLGQGSGTNRTRLTSSPNAANIVSDLNGVNINGGIVASGNGSGGTIAITGGNGLGTGNGGNLTIQAGAAPGTGTNGQLQVVQSFVKGGGTITAGNLECFTTATNTVQDCSAVGYFIGVAASPATSGNTVFVVTHGVAAVNIPSSNTTPGGFVCQLTGGQAAFGGTSPCSAARLQVGIATTASTGVTSVPVLLTPD